jgi:hypothetical protein
MSYVILTVLALLLVAYLTGPIWGPFKSEQDE